MNVRYFSLLSFIICVFQAHSLFADPCFNLDFIRRYNGAQGKIMQEPVYFRKNRKRCGRRRKSSRNQVIAQQNANSLPTEEPTQIALTKQPSDNTVVKF